MRETEIKQARIAIEILGSFKDPRIRSDDERSDGETSDNKISIAQES